MEQATLGAGCFWGVEALFRQTTGVIDTAAGYCGGKTENPSYQDVCYTNTGHAEVVYIQFDPSVITYKQILEIFWKNHNPTTLNRQGPDVGTQYRSVIFYHTEAQKKEAEESMNQRQAVLKDPIVTEIVPARTFYRAEEYHQQYLAKRGLTQCHI
ncbi:MAG: peptide-methionine (S)-S-oxide reductase MsrA [Bacteroidetes bacterium]|nr:peptide-methionine (S)-S-oxide reductase MsrA [Bacteroidota bacterium]